MLKGKKILLAVCGSISFYKSYEILSRLRKLGADVRVMLSDGALEFCNESGFEALCDHKILSSRTQDWHEGLSHINYAKTDLILIAPCSVNTINKLASGVCDNVFMQTLIASKAPLLIAPAANHNMLEHFSTCKNLEFLAQNGAQIIEPVVKTLACGDVGKGGLADIETILYHVKRSFCKQIFKGKKVLITGGATTEKIDEVRAITNFSSGKMAKALADAFFYAGADVNLLTSVKTQDVPYKVRNFTSSNELLGLLKDECKDTNLLIMCAAISDYISEEKFDGKLKKSKLGKNWSLKLTENIDILNELKDFKCRKIGFKLETDVSSAVDSSKKMLEQKGLDAVCLNVLREENKFGSDQNEISFITKNETINLQLASKETIATKIVNLSNELR
ncbi:bifunctional phosphopantothenoylcysteine decarboxylase/phosphopantothenate--cysteine ligase CoaBC [Campylobacter sp. RM13119]|uniref:bifunctional phosphopantothenoylcysteine decarboxylase/phosphopantothenate--cysteine ligase CoaBC n=1 Tax=Campylobacter californiensis TaxID=1032243 RepID=UPI00147352E0|nr:bifunctional phosphopantothenoylcysteine decarboxylase/phosphopantothenate--cysteine ligase CoaBC [Campylobacter sp. RM13119]MBE3606971.1 bifunctional phosphopantothenoylcysteine decarboxylase/phosphopantothenate--cysteine ligase CoaBC [Campylobacter sp. RM13119]